MRNDLEKLPLNKIHALDVCSMIEQKCANIYRHFERMFSDNPGIKALWHKIASDEENHSAQFRLAAMNLGHNNKDVTFKDKKMLSLLSKLDSIHRFVETETITLSKAFEIALFIEQDLAERHIESILNYEDCGLSELFVKMEKYDQAHLSLLQKAIIPEH